MTPKPGIPLNEPTTEAGRATAGKACWALHAFTMEHNIDCTVFREGILAIEREARGIPLIDVELLAEELAKHRTADGKIVPLLIQGTDGQARLMGPYEFAKYLVMRLASESSPAEEGDR